MYSVVLFSALLSISLAAPASDDSPAKIQAINEYLYGEPNPKWLEFINNEGKIDATMVKQSLVVSLPLEPYFNAAADVKFYLYTRKHPEKQEIIVEDLQSIKSSTFDRKKPTKFIIHGWRNDETSEMVQLIKKAYLEKSDYNVIAVDWGKGASSLNYYTARHRIHPVADVVTKFIEFIVKELKVKTSQIQIAGHSLGAHIAGLVGKQLTVGRLHVIVGLDPASPLFSYDNTAERLDKNDAEYVEVVHTSGGTLAFLENLGTTDFYPNYGRAQPGCGVDLVGSCAHSRSYQFFAESIVSEDGFWSSQCGDFNQINKKKCEATGVVHALGGDPIYTLRANGVYHLETNKKEPFAKGS